jgi:hypothetical protein
LRCVCGQKVRKCSSRTVADAVEADVLTQMCVKRRLREPEEWVTGVTINHFRPKRIVSTTNNLFEGGDPSSRFEYIRVMAE